MKRTVESEKTIEAYLRRLCKENGWLCLKMRPVEVGYPDRLIVMPNGRTAWVEVKTTGKKPRPIQARRMEELQRMDHSVWVADTRKTVEEIIKTLGDGKGI